MGKERARELFLSGYNCAQAIAGGFASDVNLEEKTAISLAAGFGAGVCATRGMCGAISGAIMILGYAKERNTPFSKAEAYADGREIIEKFRENYGTTTCSELLDIAKCRYADSPSERTAEYYKARPCLGIVEFVSDVLSEKLGLSE